MLLGRLRRPGIPPRGLRLGFRFVRSPRLLLLEAFCLVQVQAVAALSWPPVLFILRLPGLLGDCGFADVDGGFGSRGTEWMFAFGRSSSSISTLLPASLMGGYCGGLGACLPFFPYLFLWSRCRSMVLGRGSAEVLPSGWFPLAVS